MSAFAAVQGDKEKLDNEGKLTRKSCLRRTCVGKLNYFKRGKQNKNKTFFQDCEAEVRAAAAHKMKEFCLALDKTIQELNLDIPQMTYCYLSIGLISSATIPLAKFQIRDIPYCFITLIEGVRA